MNPRIPSAGAVCDRGDRHPGERERAGAQLRRTVRLGGPPPAGRLAGQILASRDRRVPGRRRTRPLHRLPRWLACPAADLALGNRPDRPSGQRGREHRPHPGRTRPASHPRRSADRGHQSDRRLRRPVRRAARGEDDPPECQQPPTGMGNQHNTGPRAARAEHRPGRVADTPGAGGHPVHRAR